MEKTKRKQIEQFTPWHLGKLIKILHILSLQTTISYSTELTFTFSKQVYFWNKDPCMLTKSAVKRFLSTLIQMNMAETFCFIECN